MVHVTRHNRVVWHTRCDTLHHLQVAALEEDTAQSHHKAATLIQATYRGHRARRLPQAPALQAGATYALSEDAAATRIQATYRAHQARRSQLATALEAETTLSQHAAATLVQATYRRHHARRSPGAFASRHDNAGSRLTKPDEEGCILHPLISYRTDRMVPHDEARC